ncbi:MAG: MerR family transcriptional regulator [Rikenellaceae bacterium]
MESKKMFYTMGEVTEMFDVNSSLIRYWEKHFSVIKPVRNKKGNRLFTPKDIENFKLIYHLVKERGMTLEGAKKSLRGGKMPESREVELMDRLLNMRSLLLEVREVLKEDGDADEAEPQEEGQDQSVELVGVEAFGVEEPAIKIDEVDLESTPQVGEPQESTPAAKSFSGESSKEKELFAFYEQNLF